MFAGNVNGCFSLNPPCIFGITLICPIGPNSSICEISVGKWVNTTSSGRSRLSKDDSLQAKIKSIDRNTDKKIGYFIFFDFKNGKSIPLQTCLSVRVHLFRKTPINFHFGNIDYTEYIVNIKSQFSAESYFTVGFRLVVYSSSSVLHKPAVPIAEKNNYLI